MIRRVIHGFVLGLAPLVTGEPVSAQSLREQTQAMPTNASASAVDTTTPRRPRGKPVMPTEITMEREVFTYNGAGRRDPYKSLMNSSAIRPLLSDLRLMTVAYDPAGVNSVAILRDINTRQQYRVRVGQQLGRMRVSAIRQKAVQFTIQEYGFNRQETLLQGSDTTKVRNR
ncbi:MAG: hypothetical protein RLZZ621_1237 [Gemmatimonadota bacterium]|jgi:hypothetical protein